MLGVIPPPTPFCMLMLSPGVITYHCVIRIGGIMVRMLSSTAVDRWFEPRLGQPKTFKLVFIASPLRMQQYGIRAKTGWNQNNVSEWSDMSIPRLLFQ